MRPHRQAPPSFPSLDPSEEEETHRVDNEHLYRTPDTYAHRDVEMMSVDSNDAAARSTDGPRLGGHYTGRYTPPTQVAAAAVGRRLDLAALPPRFALAHEEEQEEVEGHSGIGDMEDYYASLTRKQPLRQPSSPNDPMYQTGEGSFPTPAGFARLQQQQQPPEQSQEDGEVQVDQDFVLSLRQEGELEALTRKAMKDARGAWKQMTMDYLHKQVAGLEQDEWMYT
ncbi:hypothetical protein LPJ59_004417 [Coemansia sp. RSA 2399]|nr:hypothetical protein LPJ59_004417 [Coemansia sp. RSA 2399]KAJ1904672.1 hypothetical protein LPJ81_002355 [Coemansia sp. IMI 209127]